MLNGLDGLMRINWAAVWGEEWQYLCRLGSAITDPAEKKEFWENLKQRKLDDPSFSIYSLFPRGLEIPQYSDQEKRFRESPSGKISENILEMLRGRHAKNIQTDGEK